MKTVIHVVIGTRPQYVKWAALDQLFRKKFDVSLIDTGQHYDNELSKVFFRDLYIRLPEVNLTVGSGSHGIQTGKIIMELDKFWRKNRPDLVVVVGDTNSTLGGALAASKLGIPLAHIEAGLRSFDRSMPEEINRLVVDQLSSLLFVTEQDGVSNLWKEGISAEKIYLVGNTMIDSLKTSRSAIQRRKMWLGYGFKPRKYAVATFHRPDNVDNPLVLKEICQGLERVSRMIPLVFSVHPRTSIRLNKLAVKFDLIMVTRPIGYLDFISLLSQAAVVLTDSGGIQEESTVLGIPCITVRPNTERPITIEKGTNRLCKANGNEIFKAVSKALTTEFHGQVRIPLWDGRAAKRIVNVIEEYFEKDDVKYSK